MGGREHAEPPADTLHRAFFSHDRCRPAAGPLYDQRPGDDGDQLFRLLARMSHPIGSGACPRAVNGVRATSRSRPVSIPLTTGHSPRPLRSGRGRPGGRGRGVCAVTRPEDGGKGAGLDREPARTALTARGPGTRTDGKTHARKHTNQFRHRHLLGSACPDLPEERQADAAGNRRTLPSLPRLATVSGEGPRKRPTPKNTPQWL